MSASLQLLIVAVIVGVFAWRAFKRYAPKTAWRLQASLSYQFERAGRPSWSRAIGRWLRPLETVSGDGCGSGCSSCGGCATNPVAKTDPLSIQLRS